MTPATRDSIARGRALFNRGEFFEAHEAWEEAWLTEAGPARLFLQGLIQIAASLLKAGRAEHPGGCLRLLDAGIEKLADAGDAGSGLALAAFIDSLNRLRPSVAAWADGRTGPPVPASFPTLEPLSR
ncbi:MAG: DUF309 domain-containing protein [Acidobacteriota bacterium]